MPSSEPASSLENHVEAVHALARVLVGSDEAGTLVRAVYQHAAEVPPEQRPSDQRAWLFRLMVDVREGDLRPTEAAVEPGSDPSFTDDPFRREVAERTAERMLPTAFAACSLRERFILAIDVLGDPPDEVLAAALDTSTADARAARDRARSALRASLRDVLKGPERMLVDVALPEDALRDHLRELLIERFPSASPGLRSVVSKVLEAARDRHRSAHEAPSSVPGRWLPDGLDGTWLRNWVSLKNWVSLRGLLGGLAFLVVVAAGLGGAQYLFSSASPEAPAQASVVDLTVRQADAVEATFDTADPAEAAAFVRRTWNRHLSVPSIAETSLLGVGHLPLAGGPEIPVLRYRDDQTGGTLLAFAFNYALMDTLGRRGTLDRERRTELATDRDLLTEQRNDQAVALWRQRDDLFLIVAPDTDADSLRSRIRF
jgi:hypothetical protein